MKDEKGHGSNPRGVDAVRTAADNYVAAHQGGVNEGVPNVTGQALYDSMVKHTNSSGWDAHELAGIAPDFDEMPGTHNTYYPPDRNRR